MADALTPIAAEPRRGNGAVAASVALAASKGHLTPEEPLPDRPPPAEGPGARPIPRGIDRAPGGGGAVPAPSEADLAPVPDGRGVAPGSNGAGAAPASNGIGAAPPNGAGDTQAGEGSRGRDRPRPASGAVVTQAGEGSRAPDRRRPGNGAAPRAPAVVATSADARVAIARLERWTALPRDDGRLARAERAWSERQEALERELAGAAQMLARMRDDERAAREAIRAAHADLRAVRAARVADASMLTLVSAELEAERVAHAVTRTTAARLATDLAAARAELAHPASGRRGRPDIQRWAGKQARAAAAAPPAPDSGRLLADLEAAATALRAAALAGDSSPAGDVPGVGDAPAGDVPGVGDVQLSNASGAGVAPAGDLPGVGDAQPTDASEAGVSPAGDVSGVGDVQLTDASAAGDALAGDLCAAGGTPRSDAPAVDSTLGQLPARGRPSAPAPARRASGAAERRLRWALVALARQDPRAAGRLLIALLPAQGPVLAGPLSYDLTVKGLGTFAVSVANGAVDVRRVAKRWRRGEALFHLRGDALALAELLAGQRRRIGRLRGPARATGRRRRRVAELGPLASADISLAGALGAGARLDPELVYAVLPFAVEPGWTRGHSFTVAQEIVDPSPRTWYVTARDGARLAVSEQAPSARADATVWMTRAAFDALLRGDAPPHGDRPTVRGAHGAVAALKRWTDRARGVETAAG